LHVVVQTSCHGNSIPLGQRISEHCWTFFFFSFFFLFLTTLDINKLHK